MRLMIRFPAQAAVILITGCLLAPPAWADSRPASKQDGGCQQATARQLSAYLDRLKTKEYSAAGEIARTAADICMDVGDLRGASRWYHTARALARRSNGTAVRDEQFRRRYKEAVAHVAPRHNDVAAAEARMAGKQGANTTASKVAGGNLPRVASSEQLDWTSVSWIAVVTACGLLLLGAAVWLRPNYLAMRRER